MGSARPSALSCGLEVWLSPYWAPSAEMMTTALCTVFTFAHVYIWSLRPSLSYTSHVHCLSLDLHMFLLCFLTEYWFSRAFGGHEDVGSFSGLVLWGTLVPLLVWIYLSSSPAWFIFVFVCARGRTQRFLFGWGVTQQQCLPILPRRLHFVDDISKPPALPFLMPKRYFKWNQKQEYPSPAFNYVGSQKKPPFLWFHW